ncbi:ATP-binding protein [Nocardia asteroides]|uniref:ATP-binding protein n=1 Tax=Nocardia asteroides TaxID=1824 RepID=UPI001E40519C|nr:anti-sigma factor [Nocardia asteroides]UGT60984.1 anti-sigma factor [Nocardia asteroides]
MSLRPHFPRDPRGTRPAARPRPRSRPPATPARVELRVAPDLSQLMTLRALAEAAGLQAGLNTAETIDLGLAVDEVATALMADPAPGSTVCCVLAVDARRITVRISGVTRAESPLDPGHFGWHILCSLTDRAAVDQAPFDPHRGGYPTVVDFGQQRQRLLRAVR